MAFFRGPDYAELEEEISSITEAKEEKQFDSAADKATEQSSFSQTASKMASLKFFRPFSCVGIIYILHELAGKYHVCKDMNYTGWPIRSVTGLG